ncbi:MAG: hypothetical protein JJT95_11385 [Pararhodobacter sp.]|nr:hypothetical protein [Pararhodobacter sp.]
MSGAQIVLDPFLPWLALAVLGGLMLAITALSLWRGLAGWWLRALGMAALLAALANPSLQTEERSPLQDIVLLLHDDTGSNRLGARPEQAEEAATHLRERLQAMGVELREARIGDDPDDGGTLLMGALEDSLADLPRDRLAGVFVVSDGIVHDAVRAPELPAPLHLVKTGESSDWDRRLILRNVPAYGILGETLTLTLRVEDEGAVPPEIAGQPVRLGYSLNGEEMEHATVPIGQDMQLQITLDRGGMNVLHFVLDEAPGELTTRNNEAVAQINGIRDRLRVLLVSGEPHTGQRTWRNLLKSDPAVDLVHFTILRPPDRHDGVPVNELSLIAFPTRELFIDKIDEFDLIILDRYRRRGILPNTYFANIARYVREGGALLVVGGPELAGAESIHYSPLGGIFPAEPTARVFERAFLPLQTATGRRHPVTAGLAEHHAGLTGDGGDGVAGAAPMPAPAETITEPGWGRWLRQVELRHRQGDVVMEGVEGHPLLVLDRVGEGRIALLASDQAWLWDRGFEGGGPQSELLRRLAHWMMAEPELEEEALEAHADGLRLRIERRSLHDGPHEAQITDPEGNTHQQSLDEQAPGRFRGDFDAGGQGVYRVRDGDLDAVVVLGPANPREYATTIASAEPLSPVIGATRGGVARIEDGLPTVRRVGEGRAAAGRGWLGITPRAAHATTDMRLAALMPPWAWLLLAAGLILGGWLREGRG